MDILNDEQIEGIWDSTIDPIEFGKKIRDLTLSQCTGASEEEIADILDKNSILDCTDGGDYYVCRPVITNSQELAREIHFACRKSDEQVRKETAEEIFKEIEAMPLSYINYHNVGMDTQYTTENSIEEANEYRELKSYYL